MRDTMKIRAEGLVAAVICLLAAGAAFSQSEPDLKPIRQKDPLTDADQKKIQAWVQFQLQNVLGAPDHEARYGAIEAFRKKRTDAPTASRAFLDALAAETARQFTPQITNKDWRVGQTLIVILAEFQRMSTLEALRTGLGHPHPAVRFLATRSIRPLRRAIAGSANEARTTIDALRDAGRKEAHPLVLREVYKTLDFGSVAGTNAALVSQTVQPVLAVLGERLRRYRDGSAMGESAERAAIKTLSGAYATVPAGPLKTSTVLLTARLLKYTTIRYVNWKPPEDAPPGDEPPKHPPITLAGLIDDAEAFLVRMVNPANPRPNVAEAMKKDDPVRMKVELDKWIGIVGTPGVLNGAPYNFPPGLEPAGAGNP